jgi:HAD superfamily hydrolase (TIGR01458 family)
MTVDGATSFLPPPRAVLLDIDGVLSAGDRAIPGSIDAVAAIRARGLGLRFLTNATRRCRADVVERLRRLGFELEVDEVVTGALAARRLLLERGLHPMLLVHPGLLPDLQGLPEGEPDAVLVGDAGEGFDYASLNRAFRVLAECPEAPLIAIARNRYFREPDGLSLDAGPFVAALEYASRRQALVTGKPAAASFQAALADLGVPASQALMVGDDLEADVAGAQAAGLRAVLVRTGKYRPADEHDGTIRPDGVADDLAGAVARWVGPG